VRCPHASVLSTKVVAIAIVLTNRKAPHSTVPRSGLVQRDFLKSTRCPCKECCSPHCAVNLNPHENRHHTLLLRSQPSAPRFLVKKFRNVSRKGDTSMCRASRKRSATCVRRLHWKCISGLGPPVCGLSGARAVLFSVSLGAPPLGWPWPGVSVPRSLGSVFGPPLAAGVFGPPLWPVAVFRRCWGQVFGFLALCAASLLSFVSCCTHGFGWFARCRWGWLRRGGGAQWAHSGSRWARACGSGSRQKLGGAVGARVPVRSRGDVPSALSSGACFGLTWLSLTGWGVDVQNHSFFFL
jgi:hypothetical protein